MNLGINEQVLSGCFSSRKIGTINVRILALSFEGNTLRNLFTS